MTRLKIRPFLTGMKHSVELEEFRHRGGYELFLKDVCPYLGAIFVKWHQGIEFGVGEIIYKDYSMKVVWTDFPEHFSFDCENHAMAKQLINELEEYFRMNEARHASAMKKN